MDDRKVETSRLEFHEHRPDTLEVVLSGAWKIGRDLPSVDEVRKRLESPAVKKVTFETRGLADWDSALLTFLLKILQQSPVWEGY